jgi:hypothetical protein
MQPVILVTALRDDPRLIVLWRDRSVIARASGESDADERALQSGFAGLLLSDGNVNQTMRL